MSELIATGIPIAFAGLFLAFVGSLLAGSTMTLKPPKGAPKGGGFYIDLDRAKRGLYLIAAGTILQMIGAVQAALLVL